MAAEDRKGWTQDELKEYVTHFSSEQRGAVLNEIVKCKIIGTFLENAEGRIVLESVVNEISNNVMQIVSLCNEDIETNAPKISGLALQIKVRKDFMYHIANLANRESQYKREITGS